MRYTNKAVSEAILVAGVLSVLGILASRVDLLAPDVAYAVPEVRLLYKKYSFVRWMLAMALTLLVTLAIGRSNLPDVPASMLSAAGWLAFWGVAGLVPSLQIARFATENAATFLGASLGMCVAALLVARIYHLRGWLWNPARDIATPFAVPGAFLFTGVGILWIMDYVAHGHPRFQGRGPDGTDYALRQVIDVALLFMLVAVLTPVAPRLVRMLMRTLTWCEQSLPWHSNATHLTSRRRLIVLLCAVVGALSATVLTYQASYAHVVGELIRMTFLVALSWMAYRWVDASSTYLRLVVQILVIWLLLVLVCVLVRETGQLLVCTTVTAVTLCVLRIKVSLVARPYRQPLALLVTTGAIATLIASVFVVGPWVPHVRARIDAMASPFTSSLDFLAITKWFLAEAGAFGFGLGRVPWCGYAPGLTRSCVNGQGLPQQIVMDYGFVGVAGVWGLIGAALVAIALVCWLAILATASEPKNSPPAMSVALLGSWLLSTWCLTMIVQTALTTLGSLGVFPLTGMPLPFMAVNRAGFMTAALALALAATKLETSK